MLSAVRRVVVVTFPEAQVLDVTGPAEVFSVATRLGADPGYDLVVASLRGGPVPTTSGIELSSRALGSVRGAVDTLVVAGGEGTRAAVRDRALVDGVRRLAGRSRRVTSVCTGAFVLGQAGLLDGRRATTHWASADALARRHPSVEVDPRPIFVRDGPVWTSAGVTAGMDLALALVADDHGPEVARSVARWLVLYLQRPGGQAQFSAHLDGPMPRGDSLQELQAWMAEHLDEDLSVAALARRAAMSERHLARRFRAETGRTPADHVEALRTEAACRLLEATGEPIEVVARRCGFGTVETMYRAFRRRHGTTPARHRAFFSASA
jgi:transcriptional regulator GlxA family with amidase domain